MPAPSARPLADPPRDAAHGAPKHISSREIWSLAWPQALTMLVQFLVGFTDATVAGRIHPHLQGALGIIMQLQFFLLVMGVALVNGGVAAISQSLGAKLPLRAERYAGLFFLMGGLICGLTMLAGYVFADLLMLVLRVPQEILGMTKELWLFQLPILPASYATFISAAIYRAHKNVWIPLFSGTIVCIVNGIGDLGFGLGMLGLPNYGAHGIILASIVSVAAGATFNIAVLIRKTLLTRRSFAPWRWSRRAFPYMLKVALPAGGTQLLWQLGYMVLFFIINTLPSDSVTAVSGLSAGMRVEGILFMPGMAFSFTGAILVGHCLGAGDTAEAKRVGLRVVITGALTMSFLAACLFPFVPEITAFVAPTDTAVQAVAASYLLYNLLAVPFSTVSTTMSGIFTGAGATIFSMLAFSVGTWFVRLPLAWYMGHIVWRDASGVFIAMLASQIAQAGICLYLFLCKDWYLFASTAKRIARRSRVEAAGDKQTAG